LKFEITRTGTFYESQNFQKPGTGGSLISQIFKNWNRRLFKKSNNHTALVSMLRGRANKPNFHAYQCNWRQGKSNVEGGGHVPQIVS
jgi:hypothetical protein